MLKHVLYATAALALLAAPGLAADATVTINGSVDGVCVITPTSSLVVNLGNLALVDGIPSATAHPVTLTGQVWCNAAGNQLKVEAYPLENSVTASGFASVINYTLATPLSSDTLTSVADPGVATASHDAFDTGVGPLAGTITPISGTTKVVAGNYTGSIVITLAPGS